eukprot:TRINITY_DN7014_c0_g1_i1.p1 TRINITY_DN7014_c0_g1~~TRINITY_DN7014_c0_g1_i1.p1  ORF type:complete len:602 (-),score=118.32 TRINITY_DN7014_c0_g1_i1:968-2659(-)
MSLKRRTTTKEVKVISPGVKEGFGFKKGKGVFSKYTSRYFRLYDDTIDVYEDNLTEEVVESIEVTAKSSLTIHDLVTSGNPGFEFQSFPGSKTHWFYFEGVDVRNEWVSAILHSVSVASDEHLWKNLSVANEIVEWTDSDKHEGYSSKPFKKRERSRKRKLKEERELNQELVLMFKIANGCLSGSDVFLCPPDKMHIYFPVFFNYPKLITDLYDFIAITPTADQVAFMTKYADLSRSAVYRTTESFWDFETFDKLEETYNFFQEEAAKFPLTEGDVYENLQLVDVVYGQNSPIVKLEVQKVFASGHKPCLVEMTYEDPEIPPSRIVFKDDDLRPDLMVENLFEVFNFLWRISGLPIEPVLITFKVVPGGESFGLMEFVEDSKSIRDFDFSSLDNLTDSEDREVFLATAAGGFVGAFILGIRDRHKDNLMVKGTNQFFQLDFKHAFNYKTRVIDSCRFAIPSDFKTKLKAWGKWKNFKNRCVAAHLVLRRNAGLIIELCKHSFSDIFDTTVIEQELVHAFYLDRTEEQAAIHIKELIESGVTSVKRMLKNATHELSGNIKLSNS